ncbi:MAG: NAD(P)/FAD-dependent oxidoreductase [Armatimonadota bacterium]|nr:NAD(P)/FAD-dependent oxidoreductase [Armatimonadota bacterium]MDR7486815.1 NAD(P)/FAD-dependent oxidoreductase [Armatimonadota bacterium]MDR7533846.1 NAD(P)/FAD-dependent oxidoreductase [Armatimonadota bacterium]MDR7535094.1 NAD(P)/FAD-dependent oxidoreductase [Armatimonadota bacterium]
MSTFDVVVAGAGHNSLLAAAYLAVAGLSVVVLEERPVVGGNTASEPLTLPGFLHDTCSTAHNLIQSSPTLRFNELGLDRYGLEYLQPDPVVHVPFPDGTWLTQWRDVDRTCEEIAKFSRRDADAYRRLLAAYDAVRDVFTTHRYTPVGLGPTLEERLQAIPGGAQWLRRQATSAWAIIRDTFEDEHVRAFMLWMAFMTMQPPDRPGTGVLAYQIVFGRQRHSWTLPRGGSAALPLALARCLEDHGGVILTGRRVAGLLLEDGRCAGVETADGERFRARRGVLSTIHVKHLLELAPRQVWPEEFVFGVDTWQPGVTMFVAHYATAQPPRFPVAGGVLSPVAAGVPTSVDRMLRVGSEFLRGRVALDDPVLLVLCATMADPGRAPPGRHTLKVIGFQPYALPEGPDHWDTIKEDVAAANLAHLRRYAPNLTDEVLLASVVKSPLDLERFNRHNWHGSCHGGDMSPAQSGGLRPAPGWAQHRLPIPGLYQTGATTHPGGSVSGAPGRNAAMVMLADFGLRLEDVVARARGNAARR